MRAADQTSDVRSGPHAPPLDAALSRLITTCVAALGPGLRALCLFGSQLQPATAPQTASRGVPDLLAIVDNDGLDAWLQRQGHGPVLRWASRRLPPLTLALHIDEAAQAKLNLVEQSALHAALHVLPDLYLAGRLSKALRVVHVRDAACQRELEALVHLAADQITRQVVRGLPRRCTLATAVRACVAISYRAELRPEGSRKLHALYVAHHAFFHARYEPLLKQHAARVGVHYDAAHDRLHDDRAVGQRVRERVQLHAFLWRSQLRFLLRWPKQMLSYRGWWQYTVDKIVRAQRFERQR